MIWLSLPRQRLCPPLSCLLILFSIAGLLAVTQICQECYSSGPFCLFSPLPRTFFLQIHFPLMYSGLYSIITLPQTLYLKQHAACHFPFPYFIAHITTWLYITCTVYSFIVPQHIYSHTSANTHTLYTHCHYLSIIWKSAWHIVGAICSYICRISKLLIDFYPNLSYYYITFLYHFFRFC